MPIYKNELKRSLAGFLVWAASIGFMVVICVFMFPEMKGQMDGVTDMFANMGDFTRAFGMDRLNFGTLIGYYGIECGNVIGIGGGMFAAYIGIRTLSKEEGEHTAEFLLAHPVTRLSVVMQKLAAVLSIIIVMNVIIGLLSAGSICAIGEEFPAKEFLLIHSAYLIMQLEIGMICFGISAFLRKSGVGFGLGFAMAMYFLNLICNISEKAEFLKFITPYSYAEPSVIIDTMKLDPVLILVGCAIAAAAIVIGTLKYMKKDIM